LNRTRRIGRHDTHRKDLGAEGRQQKQQRKHNISRPALAWLGMASRRVGPPRAALLAVAGLLMLIAPAAVNAEATDATKSESSGNGLQFATAGVLAQFTVTAKDESGVRRTSGGDEWIVELDGTRSITGSVVDNLDGTYQVCLVSKISSVQRRSSLLGVPFWGLGAYYTGILTVWGIFWRPLPSTHLIPLLVHGSSSSPSSGVLHGHKVRKLRGRC